MALMAPRRPPPEAQRLTHPQSQIVQCVTFFDGFSLDHHGQELREFIARGVDNPQAILDKHVSDCGLFALAVWHAIGIADPIVDKPYQSGMAISWLLHIAKSHGALRTPKADGMPSVGSLLYYEIRGLNDDHVTFLTKPIVLDRGRWLGECIGGGGADCAIGKATGNMLWSWGRPLQAWVDVNALPLQEPQHAPLMEETAPAPEIHVEDASVSEGITILRVHDLAVPNEAAPPAKEPEHAPATDDNSDVSFPERELDTSKGARMAPQAPPLDGARRREDSVQISTAQPRTIPPQKLPHD
jgi:hypothetical protein